MNSFVVCLLLGDDIAALCQNVKEYVVHYLEGADRKTFGSASTTSRGGLNTVANHRKAVLLLTRWTLTAGKNKPNRKSFFAIAGHEISHGAPPCISPEALKKKGTGS